MPEFAYHAVDRLGNPAKGVMRAESELALEERLRGIGYWLIDASASSRKGSRQPVSVSRAELTEFYRGMASLLSAGVTAADALQAMVEETGNDSFRMVLEDVQRNLNAGNSIHDAVSQYPRLFNAQSRHLIRAGEYSGDLARAFDDLAEHQEWTGRLLADVKQASLYPGMILLAVIGLISLMFTFVVPRFARIFADLGMDMPLLTRGVVALGEWSQSWGWLLLLLIVAVVAGLRFTYPRVAALRLELDRFWLKVPVFGEINRMLVLSRFVHNLALLVAAGVPILEALSLCRDVVGNLVMANAVRDAEQAVNDGRRVSDALREHRVVSPLVLRMLVVGEETGRLDEALGHAARRLDEEIPRRIKQAFAVMEPVIMLTLIGMVGLIAGAVFLPMFSLMSGLGH